MSTDPRLGSELAGYRLEALLGRGGMGVVYRAHDLALDRNVALKILSPELAENERFRERFLTESRLAASIDHPNIIPVYDAGEVAGELYIAMRYVDGSDLKRLLAEGPLSKERAIAIAAQVAGALDAAHERDLVHRDIKPSNVLLDERGHVYLADFGLSRRLGEPGAALGATQSLGTIDYVAPEQIRGGQVDGRADLYSVGCLLHECLTGKPPFSRPTDSAVLYAHLEEEPPAAPGLESVMRTALAKDPDERFQTGHELVEAARRALGIAEPKRNRWPLAAAVVGVTLIGAALAAFFLTRGGGSAALPGADTVIRIDPKTNTVADRVLVGRKTSGLAVGGGRVWVANLGDGTISMIDPGMKQVRTIAVQGAPTGIAAGDGSVVVADGAAHKLTTFDASTGTLAYSAPLRGPSNGTLQIAGGTGGVWFADAAGGTVGRIDDTLTVGSPSRQLPVPPDSRSFASAYFSLAGLAIGERAIWVAGDARGRTVWRLDLRTGRVAAKIPLRFVPGAIAVGEGAVWVTSLLDDTVSRIDPASNHVTATIHTGRGVTGIAAGEGGVWVANSFDGTVSRIDPLTNRVVATVPVGGTPKQVAVGANGIWLTTRAQPSAAPADSITVGVLSDCEGTPRYTAAYNDTIAPAELPLIERGGKRTGTIADGVEGVSIGGHPIRIVLGCADGTTGSALAEWRRLVEQAGADVVIGPLSGDEGLALPEYARRQPGIAFVNGSASSQQLRPARNTFSFWYDGAQWMAGVGAYAYKQLGWRTAVTIGGADTFDWAQVAGFDAEFCALGGTIVKRLWLPQEAQDFAGLVAKVPRSGVDGFLVEAQGPGPLLTLARDYPGLRGNLARKVVAGTTVVPPPQLGARVRGIVWGGPTNNPPRAYLATLRRAFPEIANDYLGFAFDYAYYDAMTATLQALDRVHGDLSGGEKRFMAALAHVQLDAPNGHTTLDASHRAIAPNTLYETLTASTSRVLRTIPAVDASFGGYFKPSDPPPGRMTPACVTRTPPPWAR